MTTDIGSEQRTYSNWGCPPIPYRVEGSLESNYNGDRYVHLRGAAPFEYIGCTPVSYAWDHNSELIFNFMMP
jgi:hypothetical protein